jgi:hypothetical protein
MGRQLRRVSLDFAWPLNEVWSGFLNPHWSKRKKCPACDGTGSAPDAKRFADEWYGNAPFDPVAYGAKPITIDHPRIRAFAAQQVELNPDFYRKANIWDQFTYRPQISVEQAIDREVKRLFEVCIRNHWCHHLIQDDVDALIADGRLMDFTHHWTKDSGWELIEPTPVVTADQINDWAMFGRGHDSINQWVCVKARCEREGVETTCSKCQGDGDWWPYPEAKAAYEAWVDIEPPTGDGFQVWETTSEGSPISPVFATSDKLVGWLVDQGYSEAAAKGFIEAEWAPSLIMTGGKVLNDIATCDPAAWNPEA